MYYPRAKPCGVSKRPRRTRLRRKKWSCEDGKNVPPHSLEVENGCAMFLAPSPHSLFRTKRESAIREMRTAGRYTGSTLLLADLVDDRGGGFLLLRSDQPVVLPEAVEVFRLRRRVRAGHGLQVTRTLGEPVERHNDAEHPLLLDALSVRRSGEPKRDNCEHGRKNGLFHDIPP